MFNKKYYNIPNYRTKFAVCQTPLRQYNIINNYHYHQHQIRTDDKSKNI